MRRERIYRWLRSHPLVVDSVIAGLLFFTFGASAARGDESWAFVVGQIVPLALRRRWPVATFALVAATAFVQWLLSPTMSPSSVGVLVALYAVAAYGPRWASRLSLGVGLLGVAMAVQRDVLTVTPSRTALVFSIVMLAGVVVVSWMMGDLRRIRHEYVQGLVDRATQLERERDQQAQLATAAERARIAREMHDVVAHSLSVMVVQADGGRYAADHDPAAAKDVLETISDTGREALTEMRRLLGVLRADAEPAELAPQPGLDRLDRLVEQSSRAGVPVNLVLEGTPRPLERGIDLAVYRLVQEALTNVLKHGGPGAKAHVTVRYERKKVQVTILDDGRGAAAHAFAAADPGHSGHGLVGMRERVAAYGGTVRAGPRPGGGWSIEATFPDERKQV